MNDDSIFKKSKKTWDDHLRLFPESHLQYPDENLIRLFSGRYVSIPEPPAILMDHGFGHGNNLIFASTKGYECKGCEISDNLIEEVNSLFKHYGKEVDLRKISGLDIPFENESCDILTSWNSIHYNGTKSSVVKVIDEFFRILKPGGVLLLSTLHPSNSIFDRMKQVDDYSYQIIKESPYDNRKGLIFFAASSQDELKAFFSKFSIVMSGELYFNLFKTDKRHAAYLIYALKQ